MLPGCWAELGGTVSTQVTNSDGTEADLIEHLSDIHRKGTKGFTDEYLTNLHKTLHQRRRDPLLEHTHPEEAAAEQLTPAGQLATAQQLTPAGQLATARRLTPAQRSAPAQEPATA
jgi:hypothetical protein